MRFGYWLPVFGGWLRNVPDEGMEATWPYVKRLARRSEEIGYDLTLIAELFMNDIKLQVIDGAWREPRFSFSGRYYGVDETILEPKPVGPRRPTIYAGGESEAAKRLIASACDAYVTHGDAPHVVRPKVDDMRRRREETGKPPLQYGMAAFAIVRDTEAEARRELARITDVAPGSPGYANYADWIANTQLESRVTLEDYSVSNRGLRAGLVGTPEQVAERVRELAAAGVDLLLLQFSPQLEEMERFAEQVMPLVPAREGRDYRVA